MRADIAESIRHDVVTDDQHILEVVPTMSAGALMSR